MFTKPIMNYPEWINESLIPLNEVKLSDEQIAKANSEKIKAEKWLTDNGFTFDTHSHGNPHLFNIYIRDKFNNWILEFGEVRTKQPNRGRGFYGEYHETGEIAWYVTAPSTRHSSNDRKKTSFKTIQNILLSGKKVAKWMHNGNDFLDQLQLASGVEIKNERASRFSISFKVLDAMQITFSPASGLSIEVRGRKGEPDDTNFGFWWSWQGGKFNKVNPHKGEMLLKLLRIINEITDGKVNFPKLDELLEEYKDKPIEEALEASKEYLKPRVATKRFGL